MYTFADLSVPGASQDFATGINDLGQIVGYYGYSGIGFLYSDGAYTAVSYPAKTFLVPPGTIATPTNPGILIADHADITEPTAINDSGQIVGWWELGTGYSGFVFSGGTYTGLLVTTTDPFGINNAGQIVVDNRLYSGGTYTTLPPLAANTFAAATDINNVGQIVGHYFDGTHTHTGSSIIMAHTRRWTIRSEPTPSSQEKTITGKSSAITRTSPATNTAFFTLAAHSQPSTIRQACRQHSGALRAEPN